MAEIKVSKEFDGIKIERFIKRLYPHLPMSFIFKLLRKGKVRVNKRQVSNNFKVREQDLIILHVSDDVLAKESSIERRETVYEISESDIIYDSDDFLVINKPSGFAVHGGESHTNDVILESVYRYLKFDKSSLRFPPTPVHRLDIETSGVLVFAKNYEFLRRFNELQREQKVHKEYITLVSGYMREHEKSIVAPVIRRDKIFSDFKTKEGKTIIKKIGFSNKFESESILMTLLRVIIKTGRTHQIRSHLMQIGMPVVGDKLYGDSDLNRRAKKVLGLRRQFLHSLLMQFEYREQLYRLKAPLPQDILNVLKILDIEYNF